MSSKPKTQTKRSPLTLADIFSVCFWPMVGILSFETLSSLAMFIPSIGAPISGWMFIASFLLFYPLLLGWIGWQVHMRLGHGATLGALLGGLTGAIGGFIGTYLALGVKAIRFALLENDPAWLGRGFENTWAALWISATLLVFGLIFGWLGNYLAQRKQVSTK